MQLQIRFGVIEVHITISKDNMLTVYTKNGIELIDESLNTNFNDYEINFEKNLIIDSNNNLVYSINGDFVGKILGGGTPIPSQYIVADCIQIPTTGYINTEIAGSPRYTRSKFKVTWFGSATGTRGLYGVRAAGSVSSTSYNVYLTVNANGPRWDNTGSASFFSAWQVNETHEVELTHTPEGYGQSIVDGVVVATGNIVMDPDYVNYIYINSLYTASTSSIATGGTMRWHGCQIWPDGNTLSADFVPVFDTVGQEAGFYDIVRQRFFGNDGSGTITAYDANGDPITGGLLGMSPNMMLGSINKPISNITVIGPDDEEEER